MKVNPIKLKEYTDNFLVEKELFLITVQKYSQTLVVVSPRSILRSANFIRGIVRIFKHVRRQIVRFAFIGRDKLAFAVRERRALQSEFRRSY